MIIINFIKIFKSYHIYVFTYLIIIKCIKYIIKKLFNQIFMKLSIVWMIIILLNTVYIFNLLLFIIFIRWIFLEIYSIPTIHIMLFYNIISAYNSYNNNFKYYEK